MSSSKKKMVDVNGVLEAGFQVTATSINLKARGFTDVSEELRALRHLERLNLAENQLSSSTCGETLAKAVGPTLKWLSLARNKLQSLDFSGLTAVATLNVCHNQLSGTIVVPSSTPHLRALILSNNQIQDVQLPQLKKKKEDAAAASAAASVVGSSDSDNDNDNVDSSGVPLPHLNSLVLSHNMLSSIPDGIMTLTGLTKLSLSHNRIKRIPPLPATLCELRINSNRVTQLPEHLAQCPRLKLLDVGGNLISQLSQLDVIGELPYLRNLNCHMCPVTAVKGYKRHVEKLVPLLSVFDSRKHISAVAQKAMEARAERAENARRQHRRRKVMEQSLDDMEDEEDSQDVDDSLARAPEPKAKQSSVKQDDVNDVDASQNEGNVEKEQRKSDKKKKKKKKKKRKAEDAPVSDDADDALKTSSQLQDDEEAANVSGDEDDLRKKKKRRKRRKRGKYKGDVAAAAAAVAEAAHKQLPQQTGVVAVKSHRKKTKSQGSDKSATSGINPEDVFSRNGGAGGGW